MNANFKVDYQRKTVSDFKTDVFLIQSCVIPLTLLFMFHACNTVKGNRQTIENKRQTRANFMLIPE